ncbi:hypothetical protein ACQ4LK_24325, partial [Bacillus pumilus]
MYKRQTPHGGVLINRVNEEYDLSTAAKEIELDAISFADLELIAIGGYSPVSYTHLRPTRPS